MHTDDGGVDHLDGGIMSSGKRVYDTAQTPARRHLTKRL